MEFPAAHSMDTDWFALDEDGNVALFVSGEPGAVPEKGVVWCGPGGPEDGREAFWQTVLLGVARVAEGEPDELPEGFGVAAFRTEAAARAADGTFAWLPFGDFWWAMTGEDFDPECEGCVGTGGFPEEAPIEAAKAAGMFVYEADYGDPGIYERSAAPSTPVQLSADELREVWNQDEPTDVAHRFPLKFSDTAEFNIGDHVYANHWGGEIGPDLEGRDDREAQAREAARRSPDQPERTSRALIMLVLIALVVLALLVLDR